MSDDLNLFDKPHRLHPASIVINCGVYFIATIKNLAFPLVGIFFAGKKDKEQFLTLMIAGAAALIGGISLIGPVLNYFSTTFYIENESLVISTGFVWRKRRTIPLARIQNVNVERTLWHRILGAAAVKVETAAGSKAEGELTALSLENANKLQAVLLGHGARHVTVEEPTEKPQPLYELSPRQVILAGALGNRAVYIIGSVIAVVQFEGSRQFFRPVLNYFERMGPVMAATVGALSFVGLIFVGWLLSIVISATRYYGFRIEKHDRGLLLSHGLITQFKTIIPVGRIQDVRIVEPILFRLFGYCEMYADTAGSFDRKDAAAANKICPILPEGGASQIGKLLLPEFEFETLEWRRVSPKTIGLHARRIFIAYMILFIPLAVWLHWWSLLFIPPLIAYCWIMGIISYRYVGYSFTNDLLVARTGVFRKQAMIIPFDRIQHYTINASYFQRRLGLTTIVAVSGSSGGHPIVIADVPRADADTLSQTIGTAIQKHLGSRRGGL